MEEVNFKIVSRRAVNSCGMPFNFKQVALLMSKHCIHTVNSILFLEKSKNSEFSQRQSSLQLRRVLFKMVTKNVVEIGKAASIRLMFNHLN